MFITPKKWCYFHQGSEYLAFTKQKQNKEAILYFIKLYVV